MRVVLTDPCPRSIIIPYLRTELVEDEKIVFQLRLAELMCQIPSSRRVSLDPPDRRMSHAGKQSEPKVFFHSTSSPLGLKAPCDLAISSDRV